MREFFDRDAIFVEVEMDIKSSKDAYIYLFSLFIKYDALDEALPNYEEFLELKESLIVELELQSALYAGMRVIDGWSELYFYAKNPLGLDKKVREYFTNTPYKFESNSVKDAKKDFYFHHLLPTKLEYLLILSQKIVDELLEEGDDIALPREVEHYCVFDTRGQKERFLDASLACGYTYKDDISSQDTEHGVAITKEHSLQSEVLRGVIEQLVSLVEKEHGSYELWSTILACGSDRD